MWPNFRRDTGAVVTDDDDKVRLAGAGEDGDCTRLPRAAGVNGVINENADNLGEG